MRTSFYKLKPTPMENVWEVDTDPESVDVLPPRYPDPDPINVFLFGHHGPVGMDAQALWVWEPGWGLSDPYRTGRVITPPVYPQPEEVRP